MMHRNTAYELLEKAREQLNKGMRNEAIKKIEAANDLAPQASTLLSK